MTPDQEQWGDLLRRIEHLADADAAPTERAPDGIPSGSGLGKYRILERIRTYHNAIVYKARDMMLDRLVAIKQLAPSLIDNPVACGHFRREAQLLARLPKDARYVVNIHELIEERAGLFIVEEFVPGHWLENLIFKRHVDHKSAYRLLKSASLGLRTLHSNLIGHRDVHPGNLMVTKSGFAKIANLASAAHEGDLSPPPVVTPKYAAPELLLERKYDNRVDIYGLGMSVYEACVGRTRLEQHFAAMLEGPGPTVGRWIEWQTDFNEHLPDATELNPLVPSRLSVILRRMTAKPLEERFTSIEEVLDALADYLVTEHPTPSEPLRSRHAPSLLEADPRGLYERPRLILPERNAQPDDPRPARSAGQDSEPRRRTSTHYVRSEARWFVDEERRHGAWSENELGAPAWSPAARRRRQGSRPSTSQQGPPRRVVAIPAPPLARPEVRKRNPHVAAWSLTLLIMLALAASGVSYAWYYYLGPGSTHPIEQVMNDAVTAYDLGQFKVARRRLLEAQAMDVRRPEHVAIQNRAGFWLELIEAQELLKDNRFEELHSLLRHAEKLGISPSKVEELQQKAWAKQDAYRLAAEGLNDLSRGDITSVELKLDEYEQRARISGLDPSGLKDRVDQTRQEREYRRHLTDAVTALKREEYLVALSALEKAESIHITTATRELRAAIQNAQQRHDWIIRGDQALLDRDFADAEEAYTRAIQISPSEDIEQKARIARAQILLNESREAEAKGDLLLAERKLKSSLWNAVTPEAQVKWEKMQPAYEAARIARRAQRETEAGNLDKAMKLYRRALPALPEPARQSVQKEADALQRRLFIESGDEALKKGDADAAIRFFERARTLGGGKDIERRIEKAQKARQ